MLNLDTHMVVALLDGSLSPDETALISATPLAISSTAIRALSREEASIRYLTPDPVAEYIRSHKLYG